MFSRIQRMSRDFAFSPNKDEHARMTAARYAESVLYAFLQGQERAYAVRDVVAELKANFGAGAAWPIALIEEALITQDEVRRTALVTEAMEKITSQVRLARGNASGRV